MSKGAPDDHRQQMFTDALNQIPKENKLILQRYEKKKKWKALFF